MRYSMLIGIMTFGVGSVGCATREAAESQAVGRLSTAPAPATSTPRATLARGSRATPSVGNFVRERQAQLQVCYQDEKDRDLTGSATIAVTLADDGRVEKAAIAKRGWSHGNGRAIEKCLLATVQRWQFPTLTPNEEHKHSFTVVFIR
jgi:outer membrane biosynthesis protein TonB